MTAEPSLVGAAAFPAVISARRGRAFAVALSGVCAVCRLMSRSEAAEGRRVPHRGGNVDGLSIGYPETFFLQILWFSRTVLLRH